MEWLFRVFEFGQSDAMGWYRIIMKRKQKPGEIANKDGFVRKISWHIIDLRQISPAMLLKDSNFKRSELFRTIRDMTEWNDESWREWNDEYKNVVVFLKKLYQLKHQKHCL